jgi:hypothetical protein
VVLDDRYGSLVIHMVTLHKPIYPAFRWEQRGHRNEQRARRTLVEFWVTAEDGEETAFVRVRSNLRNQARLDLHRTQRRSGRRWPNAGHRGAAAACARYWADRLSVSPELILILSHAAVLMWLADTGVTGFCVSQRSRLERHIRTLGLVGIAG